MIDDALNTAKNAWAWLPTVIGAVGGFLGGLFYVVQLYESRTFQHWKNNFLMKRRAKKLLRLEARKKILIAQIEALKKIKAARSEARELVREATAEASKLMVNETAAIDAGSTVETAKKIVAADDEFHAHDDKPSNQ